MPRTKKQAEPASPSAEVNGPALGEVLTLSEAAAYLRLPEAEVVRLVNTQDLPGRLAGMEWRFLKSAIQAWLSTPSPKRPEQGIWAAAGALKDDPYLEELLEEIDRMRGRPTTRGSPQPPLPSPMQRAAIVRTS
jgi:excisionase family DNA binding protein